MIDCFIMFHFCFMVLVCWFGFLCIIRVLSGRPGLDWVHDWDWDGMGCLLKVVYPGIMDHCYKAISPHLDGCMVIRRNG